MHPAILQALTDANHGHVRPYGNDDGMAVLTEKFRAVFDHPTLEVFPVFSGSAANCLALGSMAGASDAVICHHQSHIENDECGMPEFFTRAKLLGVGGDHGKIDLDQVEHHI
ncbi:MAG: beta-eliminating lyase-related protein, partial [bacterium]